MTLLDQIITKRERFVGQTYTDPIYLFLDPHSLATLAKDYTSMCKYDMGKPGVVFLDMEVFSVNVEGDFVEVGWGLRCQ